MVGGRKKLPRRGPKPRTSLSLIPRGVPNPPKSKAKAPQKGPRRTFVVHKETLPTTLNLARARAETRKPGVQLRSPPLTHHATNDLTNEGRGGSGEDLKASIRRISDLESAFDFERDHLGRARLVAMAAMHGGDHAAIAAAPQRLGDNRDPLQVSSAEASRLDPHQDVLRATHGLGCEDAGRVLAVAHIRTGRSLRALARLYRSLHGRETHARAWLVYADATFPCPA